METKILIIAIYCQLTNEISIFSFPNCPWSEALPEIEMLNSVADLDVCITWEEVALVCAEYDLLISMKEVKV